MSDSMRWVRIMVPEGIEIRIFGPNPLPIDEAPKGIGREVRLATEQETGMFGRVLLPPREPER